MMAPKNAQERYCAILRTRLRLALTSQPAQNIGFIQRQIETAQRRQQHQLQTELESVAASRLIQQCTDLAAAALRAEKKKPSQRRVAGLIGLPESTLRYCRQHPAQATPHLHKFHSALRRLTTI